YVLEAIEGATIALGLKDGVTTADVRNSIANGTMEKLLAWVPVSAGDMLYVDAGTVHAIAPGVVLLETQQTSDITYRLYDYGRPRELHLEQGLKVIKTKTSAGKVAPRAMDGFVRLIEQHYFIVDRFDFAPLEERRIAFTSPGCLVGLKGNAAVITPDHEVELTPGQAVVVPPGCGEVVVEAEKGAAFARCTAPRV
ncbi:MAG: class I mannose-6-phosphate isomerase, partial [Acidobacteriaceae bacterium]|nr:class I mannose-6-phosphate isomerase [Acidobacteriaceae bacterium]